MIVILSLHCTCVSSFPVSMYCNENADLSDGEDDELLPLDIEVGTDDDEQNQAADNEENQAIDDRGNQAVDDQGNQAHATTTTAASMEEENRPEFRPHRKLSRGEDL